jgi:osmoprotectant transport system substrate-binding protein
VQDTACVSLALNAGSQMGHFRFGAALGAAISLTAYSTAIAQTIVVGAKDFTEQLLMAEMTSQLLKAKGFAVHRGTGFTSAGVRALQETGIIDLYWEYTGTSLSTFNHMTEKLPPDEAYLRVRALDAERGLVWLAPSKVNNTYALAMRRHDAAAKGISSISDLASKARAGQGLRLASTLEFMHRSDGLRPLEQAYGFEFGLGNAVGMEPGAVYNALRRSDEYDVGVVFATDGRVSAFALTVLRDDRGFFPSYILAPVVRKATLERVPEIKAPLEKLSAQLDNPTMSALNGAVDLQRRTVEDVASDFLRSRALLSGP